MKNSGNILKRKDWSFLLMPQTQEIPERIIFYIIDENFSKLKNKLGQYRTLVKNFADATEIIEESRLIGYQD